MAIFQVVDQDGQKALVEVPVGSDDIWGRYVPGTVPADPSALIADLPVGAYVTDDKQLPARAVPAPYNTEAWITESGPWTAPVTGWYDVLLIGGGGGAIGVRTSTGLNIANAGYSGGYKTVLIFLQKGQSVPVTIGAGGQHIIDTAYPPDVSIRNGGLTVFGEISTDNNIRLSSSYNEVASNLVAVGVGGGFGGGIFATGPSGHFYGAGGSAQIPSGSGTSGILAGDGAPGAIRLRYYDPNKEVNI